MAQEAFDYDYSELKEHVIGETITSDTISFCIHTNYAPSIGDTIRYKGSVYTCTQCTDDTKPHEADKGLSYHKIILEKNDGN